MADATVTTVGRRDSESLATFATCVEKSHSFDISSRVQHGGIKDEWAEVSGHVAECLQKRKHPIGGRFVE